MIDIKEIYSEMLEQEKYLEEQNFNDEQIMVIGKLIVNKEYLLKKKIEKKENKICELQNEIEGYKTYTEIERANNKQIASEIEKKDKQIDLMAQELIGIDIYPKNSIVPTY